MTDTRAHVHHVNTSIVSTLRWLHGSSLGYMAIMEHERCVDRSDVHKRGGGASAWHIAAREGRGKSRDVAASLA